MTASTSDADQEFAKKHQATVLVSRNDADISVRCLPGRTPNSVKNRSCSPQKRARPPPPGAVHSNVPKLPHALKRSVPLHALRKNPPSAAAPPVPPLRRKHVPDLLSPSSFLVFKPASFRSEASKENLAPLPSPLPNKIIDKIYTPSPHKMIENIYTDDCLCEMRHFLQEFGFQTDPVAGEGAAASTLQQLNLQL